MFVLLVNILHNIYQRSEVLSLDVDEYCSIQYLEADSGVSSISSPLSILCESQLMSETKELIPAASLSCFPIKEYNSFTSTAVIDFSLIVTRPKSNQAALFKFLYRLVHCL